MEEVDAVITTLRNADNEATDAPFWCIIDPRQIMRLDINAITSCVTGLFFSREDAEAHLNGRRYAFSERARVYCFSGYASSKYQSMFRAIRRAPTTGQGV